MIRIILEKAGLIARRPDPFDRLNPEKQARFDRALYRKNRKPAFWK